MALKQKPGETAREAKKRRLVGFAKNDEGVEANKCIKIFLVSSKDEVGAKDGFCIDPMDLNQFFGEDGKIYGYKDLMKQYPKSHTGNHKRQPRGKEQTARGTGMDSQGNQNRQPGRENRSVTGKRKEHETLHIMS
ncbi:hypothetical protein KFK09_022836 [Dendrobium nobile]|uniref:histone acetyltransferase n=1 Tax=Dendrobium nobile TaxID=94219 RepID=A0A8T3AJT0_DENNO|nr:hypothetical protein KFK09_022836 [Dendrobium nobile]